MHYAPLLLFFCPSETINKGSRLIGTLDTLSKATFG